MSLLPPLPARPPPAPLALPRHSYPCTGPSPDPPMRFGCGNTGGLTRAIRLDEGAAPLRELGVEYSARGRAARSVTYHPSPGSPPSHSPTPRARGTTWARLRTSSFADSRRGERRAKGLRRVRGPSRRGSRRQRGGAARRRGGPSGRGTASLVAQQDASEGGAWRVAVRRDPSATPIAAPLPRRRTTNYDAARVGHYSRTGLVVSSPASGAPLLRRKAVCGVADRDMSLQGSSVRAGCL